ncbi:MAG: hypothetical protein K6G10_11335 [Butyrivibrio sp.]|nr:hypothetical protein [Butyrivibrio sp.]
MIVFVALALLLLAARISLIYKKNICDTLALSAGILILLLYLQAFLGGLKYVVDVAAIYCAFAVASTVMSERKGEDISLVGLIKTAFSHEVIFYIVSVAVVTFLTRDRVFTWWDDINFWSSDAKQLFFLNGFPQKYGNVSPEFGDYPPVTSLFKWLFLQISPSEYKESFQFAGYFALNSIFIMPLVGRISGSLEVFHKGIVIVLKFAAFELVMLLPGVFNGIIYYGTPADITMAIVYGGLLLAIRDKEDVQEIYYFGRIGVYAAVLLLTKSVGFEWAFFALIFYLLFGKKSKWMLASLAGAAAAYGGWLVFCLLNRRVAKLTGAGVKMATSGTYSVPENAAEKFGYFISGFFTMPMHADRNITLDISSGAIFILILLGVLLLYIKKKVDKKVFTRLMIFTLVSGLVAYGIIFLSHISIFQTEDQYLDAYAMAVSTARYGAPFALGMTILLLGIAFDKRDEAEDKKRAALLFAAFAAFVLLCADYKGVYGHLYGYRKTLADDMAYNEDMIGEDGKRIIADTAGEDLWGKRVLVMRDGHSYYWVHNTYISKEASPVALVYDTYIPEEDDASFMEKKIIESHAAYVYVAGGDEALELFDPIMERERFKDHTVYAVYPYQEGGAVRCRLGVR